MQQRAKCVRLEKKISGDRGLLLTKFLRCAFRLSYRLGGETCSCNGAYNGPHCEYETNEVPDCYLDCRNGGSCILGTPSKNDLDLYSAFWDIEAKAMEQNQFCRCKPGWYGQFCEVPSDSCGDQTCFYGSKCTESSVNGIPLYHCDCRFSNKGSVSFAGRFCQYEATMYCNEGEGNGVNGDLFCVNNGTCQTDASLGCVCPDGYRGFSCEYYVQEDLPSGHNATKPFDPVEETGCALSCSGRGRCRDGIKDIDDQVYGYAEHLSKATALASEQFEHCVCDDGWTGLNCEHEYEAPSCKLDCQNGGSCILGTPTEFDLDQYSAFWDIEAKAMEQNQFCRCKPGWYGQFCEVPSDSCGDQSCFYGSKCTESSVNGIPLYHCDCRFSNKGSVSFAGRFCQYEATMYCSEGEGNGVNGDLFCVNNGTCQNDAYLGCVCPDGYRGFSCEYYVQEDLPSGHNATKPFDPVEETGCTLSCSGRGRCRDGIKDIDDQVYGYAEHLSKATALASEQFEHCVCDDGWTGLNCEHEAKLCPVGDYHCFHGGDCDGDDQKCDCSTAQSTELNTSTFAGDHCEHPATDICSEQVDVVKYNPAKGLSFCVNSGTCKRKVGEGEP